MSEADRICELRAGARELDRQHVLSLAAGILHDAANDGRAEGPEVAAALGAARVAAFGTAERDPDWTPGAEPFKVAVERQTADEIIDALGGQA